MTVTARVTAEGADPAVDHPRHYNMHPSGIECIDLIKGKEFCIGNTVKYVWRAGLKSQHPAEDLDKALWYFLQFRELRKRDATMKTPQLDWQWRKVVSAEPDPAYRELWLTILSRDWNETERLLRQILASHDGVPSAQA